MSWLFCFSFLSTNAETIKLDNALATRDFMIFLESLKDSDGVWKIQSLSEGNAPESTLIEVKEGRHLALVIQSLFGEILLSKMDQQDPVTLIDPKKLINSFISCEIEKETKLGTCRFQIDNNGIMCSKSKRVEFSIKQVNENGMQFERFITAQPIIYTSSGMCM